MNDFYIGIDVGATFTKGGLVRDGEIIYRTRVPSQKGSLEFLLAVITEILNTTKTKPAGIGICFAGMTTKKRVLLSAINLGFREPVDIAAAVEEKFGIPTRIGNDIACFALAQMHESKIQHLVYMALGTGINVGVISGGKLYSGANDTTLEYGHTCFWPVKEKSTPACVCGLSGCVELFVGGKALMTLGKNAGIEATTPEQVFAASREIADGFISCLSTVLLNITNTYRPDKIFLGGGLTAMIEPYVESLNKDLAAKNYGYKNAPPTTVEVSKLMTDGGLLGATLLFD